MCSQRRCNSRSENYDCRPLELYDNTPSYSTDGHLTVKRKYGRTASDNALLFLIMTLGSGDQESKKSECLVQDLRRVLESRYSGG